MISKIFDKLSHKQGPKFLHTLMELRCGVEPMALAMMAPLLSSLPKGDGHPVLVLPGFSVGDGETYLLRQYLQSRNYKVHAWKMGRNVGPMAGLEKRVEERVRSLAEVYGTKVSLIGWSLGGVFARYVAHQAPEHVRTVISLGSPIGVGKDMKALSPLIYMTGRAVMAYDFADLLDDASLELWNHTPPVPTTAIYSRSDGVIQWRASCDPLEHNQAENVRVPGSHTGLSHNALVYAILADRLAQPVEQWQPFDYSGIDGGILKLFSDRVIRSQNDIR